MNWKLVAGLACGMALLLGACSSNNASGTTTGGSNEPGTGNGMDGGDGGSGDDDMDDMDGDVTAAQQMALDAAEKAYDDAIAAVAAAAAAATAAETADTPAARREAARLIGLARTAITAAVTAAEAAVEATDGGSDRAIGLARIALNNVDEDWQTEQGRALDNSVASYAWYRTELVRYTMLNGEVQQPADAANTVEIDRTPRTKDTSATDDTQIANTGDGVIKADTFKTIMYEENKRVFSVSGDEFEVEGYAAPMDTHRPLDTALQTGLKITNSGIEIRTGGRRAVTGTRSRFIGRTDTDYGDMRKKINHDIQSNDADAIEGQGNAWDLKITFDEPTTTSSTGGETNWFGNGDFYWRGIVPADKSQTESTGDNYVAGTFTQAAGRKDLGLYEMWLSNHIGVDRRLEPGAGSGAVRCPNGVLSSETGNACPSDDRNQYLDYAAYGMFLYSPDNMVIGTGTVRADGTTITSTTEVNNRKVAIGRVQSMYFGYAAFKDEAGKRPKDIGTAITGATFRGQSLARAYTGGGTNSAPSTAQNRFLRADVTLTVNIGKGDTGSTNIKGEVANFAEWHRAGERWVAYPTTFKAYWNADGTAAGAAVPIAAAGTFNGVSRFADVAGVAVGTLPALDPSPGTATAAGGQLWKTGSGGLGLFEGSFYGPGPGTDGSDLEIAGSWSVGEDDEDGNTDSYKIVGSFGAKQWAEE